MTANVHSATAIAPDRPALKLVSRQRASQGRGARIHAADPTGGTICGLIRARTGRPVTCGSCQRRLKQRAQWANPAHRAKALARERGYARALAALRELHREEFETLLEIEAQRALPECLREELSR